MLQEFQNLFFKDVARIILPKQKLFIYMLNFERIIELQMSIFQYFLPYFMREKYVLIV